MPRCRGQAAADTHHAPITCPNPSTPQPRSADHRWGNCQKLPTSTILRRSSAPHAWSSWPHRIALCRTSSGPSPPSPRALTVEFHVGDVGADHPHQVQEQVDTQAAVLANVHGWPAGARLGSSVLRGAGPPDPVPVHTAPVHPPSSTLIVINPRAINFPADFIHPQAYPSASKVISPFIVAMILLRCRPSASGVRHPRRTGRLMERHGITAISRRAIAIVAHECRCK